MDLNDLRQLRAAAADAMQASANSLATLENAETSDDDAIAQANTDFEAAQAEFTKLDAQVKRAEVAEAAQVAAAMPAPTAATSPRPDQQPAPAATTQPAPGAGGPAPAAPADPNMLGADLGLMILSLAAAKCDPVRAARRMEAAGHSQIAAALETGTDTAGGFLVPDGYTNTVIDLLQPRSVGRRLGARVVDMPAGKLRSGVLTGGASAGYRGEGAVIPVSDPTFGEFNMDFKSLGAFVVFSNEVLQMTSPSVGAIARDNMLNEMALRETLAFIRGDGSNDTPIGLRSWALPAHTITANATVNGANVEADLRKARARLWSANVPIVDPVWVMHSDVKAFLEQLRHPNGGQKLFPELDDNMLLGYRIEIWNDMPVNLGAGTETEVFLAEGSDLLIGDAQRLTLESSSEASFIDSGANVISLFQTNQSAMRTISAHDFAPMHREAIVMIQGANWTQI
ncbi:MAG: phage major capsid protein [Pseudomonadota bacterium]